MERAIFLFNHDAGHQVAHLAGIAAAMARKYRNIETIVAYATPAIRDRLNELIPAEEFEPDPVGRTQAVATMGRPRPPLGSAVACQQAISAAPVSAAV